MLKFLFGMDGTFTSFMEKVADIFLVSLCWIVCSIPVITIPMASAALYYAVMKVIRKQRGMVVQEFWSFVKKNWKQGMVLGILYLVLGMLIGYNIYAVFQMEKDSMLYQIYIVVSMWLGLCFIFLNIYLFPVFSRFDSSPWRCICMSIFFSWRHIFSSIFLAVVTVPMIWVMVRYPLFMMIMPGILAFFLSFRIEIIMRRYMPEPENLENLPWYYDEKDDCEK